MSRRLTAAEIAGLAALGVKAFGATGAGVTLTVAQALALEAAGITLTAPSGDSVALLDAAANIEALTATQIAALTSLHVSAISVANAGLTLSVAQALAMATAGIALTAPSGDSVALLDAAANIEALTATQIASLASTLHVTQIEASDASLAVTSAQAVAFETAHITLSAPIGDSVGVSDTAAHLEALTAAQIAALTGIGVGSLYSTNANVSYTATQTAAILASGLSVTAAGSDTVTENFANGDYSVYESGALIQQKSINADGSYDIAYFDVTGLGYSSYEKLYNTAGTSAATAENMTNGSGTLILHANDLTMSSSSGQLSVTTGNDTFALNPHANEAITASGVNSETFEYASGFGQSAITGFLATGARHDVVQLRGLDVQLFVADDDAGARRDGAARPCVASRRERRHRRHRGGCLDPECDHEDDARREFERLPIYVMDCIKSARRRPPRSGKVPLLPSRAPKPRDAPSRAPSRRFRGAGKGAGPVKPGPRPLPPAKSAYRANGFEAPRSKPVGASRRIPA